jgi:hypothetical protein
MQALSQLSYSPTESGTLRRLAEIVKKSPFDMKNKGLQNPQKVGTATLAGAGGRPSLDQLNGMLESLDRAALPHEP